VHVQGAWLGAGGLAGAVGVFAVDESVTVVVVAVVAQLLDGYGRVLAVVVVTGSVVVTGGIVVTDRVVVIARLEVVVTGGIVVTNRVLFVLFQVAAGLVPAGGGLVAAGERSYAKQ